MPTKEEQKKNLEYIINQEGATGSGFLSDIAKTTFKLLANSYRSRYCDGKARPLQFGELHLPCHNFTGPGTNIRSSAVRNMKPYNNIDAQAKKHDIAYYNASFMTNRDAIRQAIKKADQDFIKNIEPYKSESGYKMGKAGIEGKMQLTKLMPRLATFILGKNLTGGKYKKVSFNSM